MSVEPQAGMDQPTEFPDTSPPEVNLDSGSEASKHLRTKVPVATPPPKRAGTVRPKLVASPDEPEVEEELLPPSALKGWATSVSIHAVLLIILAFCFLTPNLKAPKIFDTRLAGSEFGDDSSDQLRGGLGMDTPLLMPESDLPPLDKTPTITSLPAEQIALDPSVIKSPNSQKSASNGGGVNLTNPGQGGSGDGFGVARFGHGGEKINGVDVKVGDPQFTLIWDSKADLDLHVLEPGGSHIYWEERNGKMGGELDVDDVDGYGPENVYWGGAPDSGDGPPGEYKWYVHYYGGFGGSSQPTRWKMRLKHDGKVTVFQGKLSLISEKSQQYKFKIEGGKATMVEPKKEK